MSVYELALRSLSPLALHAERSRTQFTPGRDYVPGSAVRGALATHYLQHYGPDADFQALFVAGQAMFMDLLPATERESGQLMPATALLCKRFGWSHPESLSDSLLRLALSDAMGHDPAPLEDESWSVCPVDICRQNCVKRDRVGGYATRSYERIRVTKRMLTGTSINRETGTAQERMLFSHEALEEAQFFRGTVHIAGEEEESERLFDRLVSLFYSGTRLRLGAARSRGLGVVEIIGWSQPSWTPNLAVQWVQLNQAVRALWQHFGQEPEKEFFSLTLASHLMLGDEAHQPVTRLEERANIGALLGLERVTLKRNVIVPAVVRGWNAQSGLPKEDEPALGRGSVLFFEVERGAEEAARQRLTVIEREGLGRRRSEGFGQVRVCVPFHYDFIQRELGEANNE